jgi:TRAP-type uncharacterized transport system fused permease subunit
VLALAFSAFEIYTVGFAALAPLVQRGTMLAFAAVLVFLLYGVLILAALLACFYVVTEEAALADRSGAETQLDLVIAVIGPAMLLEMVRRVVGLPLFFVTVWVLVYAYLGDTVLVVSAAALVLEILRRIAGKRTALGVLGVLVLSLLIPDVRALLDPAAYPFQGHTHERMAAYLWLTSEGTFGTIAAIMSQFIFIFILFAAFLEATGAGATLMNLAFALTGRFRGGPAQAAVVASSMFGMVSGSTMANVVSTGTFTIPVMIRSGFSRIFAGAVESVASCGGQIVPPIMGAGVFIMSEIIGVPYAHLMLYALLPALLYFASLSASIYFESARLDLKPTAAADMPRGWAEVRKGGYLLIPIAILLVSIISGETPGLAGFKAVVTLIVMVDLVRSLRWARQRWRGPGAATLAAMLVVSLFLAYGPVATPPMLAGTVTLPMLGDTTAVRLALLGLGLLCAAIPMLRGLPIGFPMMLALANWRIPPELLTDGQVTMVGAIIGVVFAVLAVLLIAMSVNAESASGSGSASARALGRSILAGLDGGARNSLSLVAATCAIGMIVGLLVLTAVGVRISIVVTDVAATSLFLAFFLVMIASLILGMGLPTVAAYLLLVIVVAPSIKELGASLVAAHMFIFYYGVLSSITPPVALAAYGASGISGADPMRTGFTACRIAITAFIVPYLFVYHPELLLLEGSAWDVAYRLAVSGVGIVFVSMASIGFGLTTLNLPSRGILIAAAVLLFLEPFWLNGLGLLIGAGHVVAQRVSRRRAASQESAPN